MAFAHATKDALQLLLTFAPKIDTRVFIEEFRAADPSDKQKSYEIAEKLLKKHRFLLQIARATINQDLFSSYYYKNNPRHRGAYRPIANQLLAGLIIVCL